MAARGRSRLRSRAGGIGLASARKSRIARNVQRRAIQNRGQIQHGLRTVSLVHPLGRNCPGIDQKQLGIIVFVKASCAKQRWPSSKSPRLHTASQADDTWPFNAGQTRDAGQLTHDKLTSNDPFSFALRL